MSLINPNDTFAMSTILVAGAAFAFWAEEQHWGRKLSGPVWAIVFGMVLTNFKVISADAQVFNMVNKILVPVAIPLLLFKADLRRVIAEGGTVLTAFLIGAVGIVIGVFIAFYFIPLGAEGSKIAGVFAATYIGGSMNFVAVSKALAFDQSSTYAAALAVDNLMGILYLLLLISLPTITYIMKIFPSQIIKQTKAGSHSSMAMIYDSKLNFSHLSMVLTLSLLLCVIAKELAKALGVEQYTILFITLLAIIIANLMPKKMQKIEGDFALGTFFMYLFFVTIGAVANIADLAAGAIILIPFVAIIISTHLIILLIGTKILHIDFAETLTASNACILGPAPAAAVAAGQGWKSLVTPGILCGVFGYTIANFIGVILSKIL